VVAEIAVREFVTKFVITPELAAVCQGHTYQENVPAYTVVSSFKLILANSR
jgi:hypothetical protein